MKSLRLFIAKEENPEQRRNGTSAPLTDSTPSAGLKTSPWREVVNAEDFHFAFGCCSGGLSVGLSADGQKHLVSQRTWSPKGLDTPPEVSRVILISTPHRGSELASNWIGRIGTELVKLPANLTKTGDVVVRFEIKAGAGVEKPNRPHFPTSIDTLSPNNRFVLALNTLPIANHIPYHSIIGDRGRGDTPNSSDGVVPYWSSHLEGAQSERIVPSDHGAHQNKEGIDEVHRILLLNLTQQEKEP